MSFSQSPFGKHIILNQNNFVLFSRVQIFHICDDSTHYVCHLDLIQIDINACEEDVAFFSWLSLLHFCAHKIKSRHKTRNSWVNVTGQILITLVSTQIISSCWSFLAKKYLFTKKTQTVWDMRENLKWIFCMTIWRSHVIQVRRCITPIIFSINLVMYSPFTFS